MITVIIFIVAIILMISSILWFPKIKIGKIQLDTYWMITLLASILMIILKQVNMNTIISEFTSDAAINPLKILVLFFSMTFLSVYLDELGLFRYLAIKATKIAKNSQYSLFIILYITISILTVFTSNDIIILTFTPFIIYFCKRLKINPIPYLISEFVAANTLSMTLMIGNPTNIYLSLASGITFIEYFTHMGLLSFISAIFAFLLLLLVFNRPLSEKVVLESVEDEKLHDYFLLIVGIIHLILCIILQAVSSYIGIDMWLICLGFAVSLLIFTIVYQLIKKKNSNFSMVPVAKRLPYALVPFLLSMFVMVLSLKENGITDSIRDFLGTTLSNYTYGYASLLAGNLMNNIPMTVLFSNIVDPTNTTMVYASIIGSNLCAIITPIGALAGIMWLDILKKNEIEFSYLKFIKYGLIIGIPLSLVAFSLLFIL